MTEKQRTEGAEREMESREVEREVDGVGDGGGGVMQGWKKREEPRKRKEMQKAQTEHGGERSIRSGENMKGGGGAGKTSERGSSQEREQGER